MYYEFIVKYTADHLKQEGWVIYHENHKVKDIIGRVNDLAEGEECWVAGRWGILAL